MHGKSLTGILRNPAAASPRSEQYYECWANRAFYRDGWIAVSLQVKGQRSTSTTGRCICTRRTFPKAWIWLASIPAKLQELVEAFDAAAWDNMVYPLDNRSPAQKFNELAPHQRPPLTGRRRFLPNGQTVHRSVIVPLIADRSFTFVVSFRHAAADAGVLFAVGDVSGGMVLTIEDGKLQLIYNGFGEFSEIPGRWCRRASGWRRWNTRRSVSVWAAAGWCWMRAAQAAGRTSVQPCATGFMKGWISDSTAAVRSVGSCRAGGGYFVTAARFMRLIVESGPFAPDSGVWEGVISRTALARDLSLGFVPVLAFH